ncbi:MAG: DPP IV N-terminal domain-containing protein, partial [Gemmatimonadaceae bacterium]
MKVLTRLPLLLVYGVLIAPHLLAAQGTAADFARAEGLRDTYKGVIVGAVDQTAWIDSTPRFWYRRSTKAGSEFMIADAETKLKRTAFDHGRLASALTAALHRPVDSLALPFTTIAFADREQAVIVTVDTTRLRCVLADYRCAPAPQRGRGGGGGVGGGLYGARQADDSAPKTSPDGKWEALIRNYNVYLRPVASAQGTLLSTDGSEANYYTQRSITWSPDSRRVAAFRVRPGYQRIVHFVESSPDDQLQPKHSERLYNKPGDVLDQAQPVLFDVATRRQTTVDNALFPNAYDVSALAWRRDGTALTFEYNQRGHQVYRVIEIDAANGKTRAVIDEQSPTFFEYSAKKYRYDLVDGKEIIWMSERDGWNHLYLYDGITGKVKRQITKGPWVVRGVDKVDTAAKQVWFRASGMERGDPYLVSNYRIDLDGTSLTRISDDDAMHGVTYSPDMKYFVDSWSKVDVPGGFVLHRTSDRTVLMDVERTDASALYATGWKAPEVFV